MRKTQHLVVFMFALMFLGCSDGIPRKKPFIVIEKHLWTGYASYRYVDQDGNSERFDGERDQYEIGDTLK